MKTTSNTIFRAENSEPCPNSELSLSTTGRIALQGCDVISKRTKLLLCLSSDPPPRSLCPNPIHSVLNCFTQASHPGPLLLHWSRLPFSCLLHPSANWSSLLGRVTQSQKLSGAGSVMHVYEVIGLRNGGDDYIGGFRSYPPVFTLPSPVLSHRAVQVHSSCLVSCCIYF